MQPQTANSLTLKRKKWTEAEERSLMDKYAEMQSDDILARMRTREKKFRPIATHVNAGHHCIDPVAYPFLWSWKDASTKVQNMRHQYLLVKQKLLSSSPSSSAAAAATEPTSCETDWSLGLSLWPNFLRYRHVFGDTPLPPKPPDAPSSATAAERPVSSVDMEGNNVLGMGFECSDEDGGFDYEEALPPLLLPPPQLLDLSERRKKKRRKRVGREWARISAALAELREREGRLEERDQESLGWAQEEEREMGVRDGEERLRRREMEESEWEDRMEQRRLEWKKKMEAMMEQHRAEMEQIQTRVLQEQHSVVNQLIGVISHWVSGGGGCGIGDIAGMGGGSTVGGQQYVSQVIQGIHHLNEMVTGENRVGSDGPEDQFIDDA